MSASLNPVGPLGVTGATRASRVSSLNRIVIVSANMTVKAASDTKKAFKTKPFHATAVALSILCLALQVIATWTPFYHFEFNGETGKAESEGDMTLTDVIFCSSEIQSPVLPWMNSDFCTYIHLNRIAALLNFFYTAGAVSLSFLIVAIPLSIAAVFVTNARRKDAVDHIPDTLFHGRISLRFMKTLSGCLTLHIGNFLLLLVSASAYVGICNGAENIPYNIGVVFNPDYNGTISLTTGPPPKYLPATTRFSGGLVLNIISLFLSLVSASILLWKKNEVGRTSGAENSGMDALQQGFESVTAVRNSNSHIGSAYGGDDSGLPPAYPSAAFAAQPDTFNLTDPANLRGSGDMSDVKL